MNDSTEDFTILYFFLPTNNTTEIATGVLSVNEWLYGIDIYVAVYVYHIFFSFCDFLQLLLKGFIVENSK